MKYIHIAGTNGKGSTAEYLYRIIMAAGKRCGCFTSPHLISPNERLRADGCCIEKGEYDALLFKVREKKLPVNETLFAAQTAAALVWFERLGLEYAVLETGLGGRLDPTNVVQPVLSLLTAIDYDHTNILGKTLEQIAYEKSGIIKKGVPVLSVPQHPDVAAVIAAHCEKADTQLVTLPHISIVSASLEGLKFKFEGQVFDIGALGSHQAQNAALALLAARQLGMPDDAIYRGLADTRLFCRAQFIKGGPDMLLDGAHNSAAVDALLGVLSDYFRRREKILLFACMADKDYEVMADKLAPHFTNVFVTQADYQRGADADSLQKLFAQHTACEAVQDSLQAFYAAKKAADEKDMLLVAAGSFYLAGRILPLVSGA